MINTFFRFLVISGLKKCFRLFLLGFDSHCLHSLRRILPHSISYMYFDCLHKSFGCGRLGPYFQYINFNTLHLPLNNHPTLNILFPIRPQNLCWGQTANSSGCHIRSQILEILMFRGLQAQLVANKDLTRAVQIQRSMVLKQKNRLAQLHSTLSSFQFLH